MLTKIREKASGIFAWVIVAMITIPFALWGINSYFEGGGQSVVAEVEGVDIDLNTYQNALSERRRVMAQVLQQNLDSEFFESAEFKRQVLEGLIQNAAEASYAEASGYRISEELLGNRIRQLPYFQVDGQFDPDRYQEVVANAGMSVARFEQQQRQELISNQIRSAYTDSAFVTDEDINNVLRILGQVRTAEYVVIPANDPSREIKISEEDIATAYGKNKDQYFAPEMMRASYITLSVDRIAESIDVDEAELRQYFAENQSQYMTPEERRISHILIQVGDNADDAQVESALNKARELAGRARAGEDFAALAKQNSDDSGSAAKGGDLGVITSGVLVKPVEDAALALEEVGDISDPVRSRFGFHVISLTGYKPAVVAKFDEVKDQIESELKKQSAESRYLEEAERFTNIVYEQPESLEPAADDLNLEIQSTDWFSMDEGDGVAANQRFREAAFSEEVRVEGLNSEAFDFDANSMVALHRLESKDRRQLTLEEVRDQVREKLERTARIDAAHEHGEMLIKSLSEAEDWQTTLAAENLDPVSFDGTREDAYDPLSNELVDELFNVVVPTSNLPVVRGLNTTNGDYVVYRLTSITDADPAKADDARRAAVKNLLKNRQSEDVYLSYLQALREASDVTVFDDAL
ncbi:MAG: peptidylprolyl isomerase [marine bacterium B5-7]|nr:MAG: peptidylprolyl isomerase [marine bacterium B5-7]